MTTTVPERAFLERRLADVGRRVPDAGRRVPDGSRRD
jgi:hypothetical protein